jgi:long-subunit acyl-CoA synthetase (AMP-forming)
MLATLRAYADVIAFPDEGRVLSWLPMAHIAERACSHYLPIAWGYSTTCVQDTRAVIEALPEVRPTWFFAVPRIWEKLKVAIEARGVSDPAALPDEAKAAIRRQLGLDRASSINVGAAPTPPEVIEFFHDLGVPLAELWGMSESCGSGCVNPPGRVKIGTVGPPLPGFELRLVGAPPARPGEPVVGEIFLRGPGVMAGYRGAPDKTREVLDEDGWLATGDIGEIDEDGYLKIIDRKKELIINAAGKNMSPANIEAALKTASPLIGHAVAIGDRRPYNVALITLDPDAAKAFVSAHGLHQGKLEELAADDAILVAIGAAVQRANQKLARVEQVKRFRLLGAEWLPGGDELTPTQKLKRKPIAEKYTHEIEALYGAE